MPLKLPYIYTYVLIQAIREPPTILYPIAFYLSERSSAFHTNYIFSPYHLGTGWTKSKPRLSIESARHPSTPTTITTTSPFPEAVFPSADGLPIQWGDL